MFQKGYAGTIQRIPVVGHAWLFYRGYTQRSGPLLSAGIAYYALFSIGPLVLLTLEVVGAVLGASIAEGELSAALSIYLGPYLAGALDAALTELQGSVSAAATVVGVVLFVYGATKLFLRLQASFNVLWGVRPIPGRVDSRKVASRLSAFALTLVPSALLVASFLVSTGVTWLTGLLETQGILLRQLQILVPFVVSWIAFVVIFTVLPDVRLSWRDCWLGALFAALFSALGTRAFGVYLAWSGSQDFGAVGSLIVLIVWVHYMAMATLLGVLLCRALYERQGRPIRPYPYALPYELPREPEPAHPQTG